MRKATLLVLVGLAVALIATEAAARSIACNRKQTRCRVESKNLTLGDEVGVFNDDGKLVAVGKVGRIDGTERLIRIRERYGTIRPEYRFALLGGAPDRDDRYRTLSIFNADGVALGGNAGFTAIGIGQGVAAFETNVFGRWRQESGIEYVIRGSYLTGKGTTEVNAVGEGKVAHQISVQGIGVLGGVGYTLFRDSPLNLRFEAAGGVMQTQYAPIEEDLAPDALNDIQPGIGPYAKSTLSLLWNREGVDFSFDLAAGLYNEATAASAAFGFLWPL